MTNHHGSTLSLLTVGTSTSSTTTHDPQWQHHEEYQHHERHEEEEEAEQQQQQQRETCRNRTVKQWNTSRGFILLVMIVMIQILLTVASLDDKELIFDMDPYSTMAYKRTKTKLSIQKRSTTTYEEQKTMYYSQNGTSCRINNNNQRYGTEGIHYNTVIDNDSEKESEMTLEKCFNLCTNNQIFNGTTSNTKKNIQNNDTSSGDDTSKEEKKEDELVCYGFEYHDNNNNNNEQQQGHFLRSSSSSSSRQRTLRSNVCRLFKYPIKSIYKYQDPTTIHQQHQYCFRKLDRTTTDNIEEEYNVKEEDGDKDDEQEDENVSSTSSTTTLPSNVSRTTHSTEEENIDSTLQCPKPTLAPCTREYNPVLCEYTGNTTTTTSSSSSSSSSSTITTTLQCRYDNPCIAKLAGFINLETQCIFLYNLVTTNGTTNKEERDDVKDFENDYTKEEEEEEVVEAREEEEEKDNEEIQEDIEEEINDDDDDDEDDEEEVTTTLLQQSRTSSHTTTCPKPKDKPCTREYDPVLCTYNGLECRYSNTCLAKLAGFHNVFKHCVRERDDYNNRPSTSGSESSDGIVVVDEKERIKNNSNSEKKEIKKKKRRKHAAHRRKKKKKKKKKVVPANPIARTISLEEEEEERFDKNSTRNDCPEPNENGYCPLVYKPVACGPPTFDCIYSNRCFAILAGFNETIVPPAEEDTECIPVEEDRVVVSPTYMDISSEEELEEECPLPDPDGICPLLYQPVVCFGGNSTNNITTNVTSSMTCEYSNECFAKLAGWNNYELECIPKCSDDLYFTDEEDIVAVPKVDDTDDICGIHNTYNPIICIGRSQHAYNSNFGCTYTNKCLAERTGIFNAFEDCDLFCPSIITTEGTVIDTQSVGISPPPASSRNIETQTMEECLDRLSNEDDSDNTEQQPVSCGLNQCYYDNICLATIGAGYDEDQCIFVSNT